MDTQIQEVDSNKKLEVSNKVDGFPDGGNKENEYDELKKRNAQQVEVLSAKDH